MTCPECGSLSVELVCGQHVCHACGHTFALGTSNLCPCGVEDTLPSSRYGQACTDARRDPKKVRVARTVAGVDLRTRRKLAR